MNWELENDLKSLKACVNVSGVDPAMLSVLESSRLTANLWASFFSVYVESESKPRSNDLPPLLGSYRVMGKVIQFAPRFSPEPTSCIVPSSTRFGCAPGEGAFTRTFA